MCMKKNKNRLLRSVAAALCLVLMCFTMSGMAMAMDAEIIPESGTPESTPEAIDVEVTVMPEETPEPPPAEQVPGTQEPEPTPPETAETPQPQADYELDADIPKGWHNAPITFTVRIRDKNSTGWQKAEAALSDADGAERTDLTTPLRENGFAEYTVSSNGTVYFFITDPYGTEHTLTLEVRCIDLEAPVLRAGVSGTLLRVEAYDAISGMAGVYVNDELYTTLQNGELGLRIDNNPRDTHFYIMGADNAGNRTGYLVIANPFYEKPAPSPSPTPEQHSAHCPADCDCRQTAAPAVTPKPSSGSHSGTSSGGSTVHTGGSANTQKPVSSAAASQAAAKDANVESTEPVAIEKGSGFSQNGSAVTRDLLYDKHTNKQFVAVETRNGHTLYLVIDYDKPLDEDGERYETYFLNLVDESDLMALVEDGDYVPVCTCKDKCEAGAVNTACEVCKNNMTECAGRAARQTQEPEVTPEPEPEPEQKGGGSGLLLVVLLLLLAGGGALYWFKFRKKKPDTKGPVDLDDYDYGEDEDDEEYDTEDDAEEADAGDTEDESL